MINSRLNYALVPSAGLIVQTIKIGRIREIPITTMTAADYPEFLKERRVLMAKKIRDYYEKL